MSVAIIGSGIVGCTLADVLTSKGRAVTVFEKGPAYPFPHTAAFREKHHFAHGTERTLPEDLDTIGSSGSYRQNLHEERRLRIGGSATSWDALSLRMLPEDFQTASRFGYGVDWPLTYEELEPYYGLAERRLGVSGTDSDNPFAPPRSTDYPLPPFELGPYDRRLATRLSKDGIVLHTTPQARNRHEYDQRSGCANFGACSLCPIGARYSPNHHLSRALSTGLCEVIENASVRRVLVDATKKARSIVYRENDGQRDLEHPADLVIVAAGALESARLLLLSRNERFPDGLGNRTGHLGAHLQFHHLWRGFLHYETPIYPDRFGGHTGQSHQFRNPDERGRHHGIKVEFGSRGAPIRKDTSKWIDGASVLEDLEDMVHRKEIILHAESSASGGKYMALSEHRDRFGDPFAHVHYESSDRDHETHRAAADLLRRFWRATSAVNGGFPEASDFDSGAHHMGTCRMSLDERDGVTDSYGQVHGIDGLYVLGASLFPSTSGAVNPTLTLTALTLRAAERIAAARR